MLNNEEKKKPQEQQRQQPPKVPKQPEVFTTLTDILQKGFVSVIHDDTDTKKNEIITNPELLDLSEPLAKILYCTTKASQRSDTVYQFRKFFNEISGFKNLPHNPAKLSVELRMLKARMSYAAGRETITNDFSTVINICIERIIELNDFRRQISGFCDFFESLYAYYYYHNRSCS